MKNFLGIPVEGDIYTRDKRAQQRPVGEFGPILQKALETPGLSAIRWRQYTPYFNDGDPCEFRTGDVTLRFEDSPEVAGDYEDGFEDSWSLRYNEDPRYTDTLNELARAVGGREFYDVLIDAFGDHAEVTVTKDKIDVEYYEHD